MTSVLHAHAASRASCRLVNGRTSTAPGQCKGPRRHGQTSWRLDAVKYPFASLIQQLKGTKESQSVQDEHYPETTGRPQPDCPIISCCGGGIFFFWELGVLLYLQKQFDLGGVQVRGASAGALLSTLVACDVDLEKALASATVRIRRVEAMERKLGLVGLAGQLVGDWLADLLPEDAAQRAHRRGLHIVVTEVPSFRLTTVKRFDSKQDLVQANLASTHIPFFTDGAPSYDYKGQPCIDGSLWDFVFADNSDYLKAEGRAVLVDYFKDDQLSTNRLDFIRLASPDEILSLVGFGYRYASRADEAGEFELALGRLRRSPLSRLVSGGFLPGFLFGSG